MTARGQVDKIKSQLPLLLSALLLHYLIVFAT
jgi:hypothetical protein